MPLFNYSQRSQSSAVRLIGLEAIGYWVYLNQGFGNPIYESLGHLTNDDKSIKFLTKNLLTGMGKV